MGLESDPPQPGTILGLPQNLGFFLKSLLFSHQRLPSGSAGKGNLYQISAHHAEFICHCSQPCEAGPEPPPSSEGPEVQRGGVQRHTAGKINPGLDLRAVQPRILKVGSGQALWELEPACSVDPEAGFGFLEEEAASP